MESLYIVQMSKLNANTAEFPIEHLKKKLTRKMLWSILKKMQFRKNTRE